MSNANVFPIESLGAIRKKIAEGMSNASLGPMAVAEDVIALSSNWDALYGAQAGGKPLSEWLKQITTHGLPWFVELSEAVAILGPDVRRWMDHRAVRWAGHNVDQSHHKALKSRCHAHYVKCNRVPVSSAQVRYIAQDMGICPSRPRTECVRCAMLEALCEENGIQVPSETTISNE